MKRSAVICFCILFWRLTGLCQSPDFLPTAVHTAGISAPVVDRWSAFANPASMVQKTTWQFAMQYENRYMLKQFNSQTGQIAYCGKYINIGLCYTHFGYKQYGEMVAGIAFAHDFGGHFTLGLQADYYAAYMGPEERYQGTVLPQIGATVNIGEKVTLGFHTFNPFMQHVRARSGAKKQLPAVYALGVDYRFYKNFSWLTEVSKDLRANWRVATAFEWQAIDFLRVKLGMHASKYFVGCVGAGLSFSGFMFDVNCEVHPILGVCMQGRLDYAF